MKYCIIGAGSVGGYFGARLQENGEEVTYIVRERKKEHLDKEGLKIRSYLGDSDLKVKSVVSPEDAGECDILILAIRNFNLSDDVMNNVAYLGKKGSKIISLLNGIEHIERLRHHVKDSNIIGGSAFIDSRLSDDGTIVHRGQTPTITLGPIAEGQEKIIEEVISSFRKAGIKSDSVPDLLTSLWRKYIFVLLGSFTGVTGTNIGEIVSNKYLDSGLESLAYEIKSVAVAENVIIDDSNVREMLEEIRGMRKEWKSLLTEDIEAGKNTELESLWGYLVKKAEKHDLNVPLSRFSYGMLGLKTGATRKNVSRTRE